MGIVRNFINMNVIDNIFKIMAQKGIKQRTLADAMGIDESQISEKPAVFVMKRIKFL